MWWRSNESYVRVVDFIGKGSVTYRVRLQISRSRRADDDARESRKNGRIILIKIKARPCNGVVPAVYIKESGNAKRPQL